MASLAPHVSRVSKSYAPHGWSYVNETHFRDISAFSADTELELLVAADSDYYVESASISVAAKGGDHYLISLRYGDNDGSLSNSVAVTSDASRLDSDDMDPRVFYTLPADGTALVPHGKVLYLLLDESVTGTLDVVTLNVRYRRKA